MSDIVTCKCVLVTRESVGRFTDEYADRLCMRIDQKDSGFRDIPCYKKGRPKPETPGWEYEIRDGRVHLTPSLNCTDSGFHTDYAWSVAYEECPQGVDWMTHFFAINPDLKP